MSLLRNFHFGVSLIISVAAAQAATHKELGDVDWLRNYDQAIEQSKESGKPILILFQEVPGCQGCVKYGQETLTHPLIVDAIENDFVPLAIRNNVSSGHDREILKRFKEPAWNYQVMRFIDVDGKDIIPRRDRIWTPHATAARMVQALESAKRPVPEYLKTVALSAQEASMLKTAVFSMYCFWDGEAKLGSIDGVAETEAGWLDGREVVRVRYNPEEVEWSKLVRSAQSHGCAKRVYAPDIEALAATPKELTSVARLYDVNAYRSARASDQKRHLQFSKVRNLPLNPVQRTKINAALASKDIDMISKWLSPSQRKQLM
ncbi:MAG: VPGUxxT family thioredoxin-like (seleno)protein, type 2 [Verrucomicrobiota bacterium]